MKLSCVVRNELNGRHRTLVPNILRYLKVFLFCWNKELEDKERDEVYIISRVQRLRLCRSILKHNWKYFHTAIRRIKSYLVWIYIKHPRMQKKLSTD